MPGNADGSAACGTYGSRRLRRRAQMLREEGERPAPGQIGRRLVVASGAGVVVEGVLGAGIDVDRIFLVVGGQRRLIGGDAFVDVIIGLGILQEKRRPPTLPVDSACFCMNGMAASAAAIMSSRSVLV